MKVAIVHELLTMRGGAEKVLRIFAEMFPDAPIYTLLYNERKLGDWFPRERVRTSSVQKIADRFPLAAHRYNHHRYLRKFPAAVEAWDFSDYDLVLSASSAFAHGIITNGKPRHLCYVHSPARYLWDRSHDVLERAGKGLLGPLKRPYLSRTFHKLRTWDAEAADRPDRLVAASKTVQRRIGLYWHRESTVVTPPIDDFWLDTPLPSLKPQAVSLKRQSPVPNPKSLVPSPYFLVASTLAAYKRIDLAIAAANRLKVPLKIAGEGQDMRRLRPLAGPTVEFLGYRSQEELRDLYAGATATIFPGDEDFGLVPLESLASGTPVIAYRTGGALETLTGDIAEFFDTPTEEALAAAMERVQSRTFDPARCRERARLFSRGKFEASIHKEMDVLLGQS